jgi:hypothetical protein
MDIIIREYDTLCQGGSVLTPSLLYVSDDHGYLVTHWLIRGHGGQHINCVVVVIVDEVVGTATKING